MKKENGKTEMVPLFQSHENISGEVLSLLLAFTYQMVVLIFPCPLMAG